MNFNKFKHKSIWLWVLAFGLFSFFSININAITFNENTYVEISPAISADVCFSIDYSNLEDDCSNGIEKPIIFGIAYVYPSENKNELVVTAPPIPLVIFDGLLLRGTGSKMNKVNSDGSEEETNIVVSYELNARSGELSDITIIKDGKTYSSDFLDKFVKNKKVLKLSGKILSEDLITSDDLLTLDFKSSHGLGKYATEEDMIKIENYDTVNNNYALIGENVSFEYLLIGLGKDRIATLDYDDSTKEDIDPTIGQIKYHSYNNEGTYSPNIKIIGDDGNEVLTYYSKKIVVWNEIP